jgi:SM-20-related protein
MWKKMPKRIEPPAFEIDLDRNTDKISADFRINRRLHIPEFLNHRAAEALYYHLKEQVEWSTLLASNGRKYEAPAKIQRKYSAKEQQQLTDLAHAGARGGEQAYLYEATHFLPRDLTKDRSMLGRLAKVLRSSEFMEFMRRVSGVKEIAFVDVQAMRISSGHFMTFRSMPDSSAGPGAKCYAFYSYNLTPEWKAEWGGLMEFRGNKGHLVEAHLPCFNCLDIFACPQGHWMSAVSPFAGGPNYSVSGGFYEF